MAASLHTSSVSKTCLSPTPQTPATSLYILLVTGLMRERNSSKHQVQMINKASFTGLCIYTMGVQVGH